MAAKVFFVLAALCCAQVMVSGASIQSANKEENRPSSLMAFTTDLRMFDHPEKSVRNPFECVPHLGGLWTLINNVKTVIVEFREIPKRTQDRINQCQKQTTPEEVEKCKNEATAISEQESEAALQRAYSLIPQAVDLARKFKACLWD